MGTSVSKHTGYAVSSEIFDRLAPQWWDETGPHALLHRMNAARLSFILEALAPVLVTQKVAVPENVLEACVLGGSQNSPHHQRPLSGIRVLDVGCGGGLLSEPLARLGATVVGLDVSEEGIAVAQEHAQRMNLHITYHCMCVEDYVKMAMPFDCVIASEVVEHVRDVQSLLKACSQLLAPGGRLVLSTLNRTWQSYLLAIVGAEYLLRFVPRGTHHWRDFLKPSEIAQILEPLGLKLTALSGLRLQPLTDSWTQGGAPTVNYILAASHTAPSLDARSRGVLPPLDTEALAI